MVTRAIVIWFGLLALAFANGACRELALVSALGTLVAHAISSILLSAAILLVAWLTTGWIGPTSGGEAWAIGVAWLALSLAFELLAGHYAFGKPWSELLADYNVARGRIWIVVLLTTVVAPFVAARLHGPLTNRPS
jgi:hypothetical protein